MSTPLSSSSTTPWETPSGQARWSKSSNSSSHLPRWTRTLTTSVCLCRAVAAAACAASASTPPTAAQCCLAYRENKRVQKTRWTMRLSRCVRFSQLLMHLSSQDTAVLSQSDFYLEKQSGKDKIHFIGKGLQNQQLQRDEMPCKCTNTDLNWYKPKCIRKVNWMSRSSANEVHTW